LLDNGHDVLILDNLSTGSIDNISHLKGRRGFEYFIDTVTNEPLLAELIDRSDVVFHFAAAVGVKLIVEQPVYTIETNVHGTEVVLKHANKKKKLVVIASTSEVYGKSDDVPFREDSDLVLGPTPKHRWAYACSKAIDEFLALAYWKERKLPVIIVRFFNTVGPRQTGQYGMVIPNFVRQALAGEAITVFGDGTQSRAFTHVADVVAALLKLVVEPKAIGQVINIGNMQEVTMTQLAERVRDLSGSKFVAGTGTINADGKVGSIGGITHKILAAHEAGATVFLVPADNCEEAKSAHEDGIDLVKVDDLGQAVGALKALSAGGEAPRC
jgi:UDP-glucose 4-epimerase